MCVYLLNTTIRVALAAVVQGTQLSKRALTEVPLVQAPHSVPVEAGRPRERLRSKVLEHKAGNCPLCFSTALVHQVIVLVVHVSPYACVAIIALLESAPPLTLSVALALVVGVLVSVDVPTDLPSPLSGAVTLAVVRRADGHL